MNLIDVTNLEIKQHATQRFVERGAKNQPAQKTISRIRKNIERATEVIKKDATLSLLNNGVKQARYFHKHPFIYVVIDNAVVTCIRNPKMRFFVSIESSQQ